MKRSFLFLLLLLIALSGVVPGYAQNTEERSFVYATNHYTGNGYASALIPPSVNEVFLLSGSPSIIAAKETNLYYWPITNEYKADWENLNLNSSGDLEIYQGSNLISSVPQSKYTLQYDGNDPSGTYRLFLDEEAETAYQQYLDKRKQYRDDLNQYHQLINAFTILYQDALKKVSEGLLSPDQLPQAPIAPPDLTLFSSEILLGYPVDLPVGDYRMQFRLPDGEIQPGSIKKLKVFEALRVGTGYKVADLERWNQTEDSFSTTETLYCLEGHTYFLRPFSQTEYNQRYYVRMNNPQDKLSREDRQIWVSSKAISSADLQINSTANTYSAPAEGFYVRQILGTKLGYEIVPSRETEQGPTFEAVRFVADQGRAYSIELTDASGDVLPGSARQIRCTQTSRSPWLYVLSSLPLIIGLAIYLARRAKVQTHKPIEG